MQPNTPDRPSTGAGLSLIVVNFGSHALLEANLGAIDLTDFAGQVVVVDNFSTDAERRAVAALAAQRGWALVEAAGNGGFGAGMNLGIARARELGCQCFLLINPDAIITRETVEALHAHSLRAPTTLIAPMIVTSDGAPFFQGSDLYLGSGRIRGHRPADAPRPATTRNRALAAEPRAEWVTGACLIAHDELLSRIGGFDEPYFLYWEDVDLSYRALQAGGSVQVRRDLIAVHDEGGTQQASLGRAKSATYYHYNCRNRLVFAARNLPRRTILSWLVRTPAVSWEILMRGGRRQLLDSPRPLLAAVRGSLAGASIAVRALVSP